MVVPCSEGPFFNKHIGILFFLKENLVSALNLVPMTSSGMASAIFLPSKVEGILIRSRKAEFGSLAGGILVEGGRLVVRLLWVFSKLKTSKTLKNLGPELSVSVSMGALDDAWGFILKKKLSSLYKK